jgi:hypothetical protein
VENSHNEDILFVGQIKDAVVLTDKVSVLCVHRNESIQRSSSAGKGFKGTDALF